MSTFLQEHKIFKNKFAVAFIVLLYILLLLPFLGNIAFDAVVHFVFAENFADGYPFKYNLNDSELVIASTSPFWTILLTFLYFIAGQFTPLIVKSISILLWLACAFLLNVICRDTWKLKDFTRYAVLLFWLANISIVKNSLGGLENVLSAFQLLVLYYYAWKNLDSTGSSTNFVIGALLGWTILTRIDAGALALIIVVLYFVQKRELVKTDFASSILSILIVSIVVLLPWYLNQYSYTSRILSDSSVARIFTGRRNSQPWFGGLIYFHPSAFTVLLTAYLPLSLGFVISLFRAKGENNKPGFLKFSAQIIVICSVLAYSFIVGADQFGRYFLICMPFFLVSSFYGLQKIYSSLKANNSPYLKYLVALLIIFLFLTNAYDYYKRVVNIEQLESNIYEVFYAPSNRNKVTSEYLQKLGFNSGDSIRLAITEVQFKYFVDQRVQVLSLDGRSSPKILKYMNSSGLPDFEKFIENEKPDVIEVKGWPLMQNLLQEWEGKLVGMKIGDSFYWKSNLVTYITPWHVRIKYNYLK